MTDYQAKGSQTGISVLTEKIGWSFITFQMEIRRKLFLPKKQVGTKMNQLNFAAEIK